MSAIKLITLGRLAVIVDEEEVPGISNRPVRGGLLVYLAIEGEATRDAALGVVWPDRAPTRARHALSQTLYALRKDLGDDWLDAGGSYLRTTDDLDVDALRFARAVEEKAFETALELYRGPFLKSCYLVSSAPFQQWVDRQERRLEALHRTARKGEIERRIRAGDHTGALRVARDWAELSPLEDEPRQHLIRLYAATGATGKALQQYQELATLLAREGLAPLPETRALVRQVQESEAVESAAPRPPSAADPRPAALAGVSPGGSREVGPIPAPVTRWPAHLRAVAVLALLVVGTIGLLLGQTQRATTAPEQPFEVRSVAVRPFENRRGHPDDQLLVDGIHDALIESVALRGLRVISRESVIRYRDRGVPAREVARALDVDAVVEGSVVRTGDSIRIRASLVRGTNGEPIAAVTFARRIEEVPTLVREVSAALLGIREPTAVREVTDAAPLPPVDRGAYESYLRAQRLLHEFDMEAAIAVYDSAIALDPSFSWAYAGLAQAYLVGGFFGAVPRELAWPRARDGALRALERDSALAGAHAVLGQIALYDDWNWSRAETELVAALQLDRNDVLARHAYADLLVLRGRAGESLRQVELARAVDPFSPLINGTYIGHLYGAREFERLLEELPRVRDRLHDPSFAGDFRALTLWELGRFDEALAEFRGAWSAGPELVTAMERALASGGPHGAMRAAAEYAAARWEPGGESAFEIAVRYALAGSRDEAFVWLERAYEERRPSFIHFVSYPAFDGLRSDPRYEKLVERIGLAPEPPTAPER